MRADDLKMLRRALGAEPPPAVAKGLALVEKLLRDVAAGKRKDDVTFTDVANMVGTLRASLMGEDAPGRTEREPAAASAS